MSSNDWNRSRHLVPSCCVEHPVHLVGGHRRRLALQLGQRLAVGLAVLLGDRGLHDRQGLADLHRAALEFAEHGEQLLGSLVHQFGVDLVFGLAGQTFAEAQRRAPGHADGQRCQLGVARGATPLDVTHHSIIHDRAAVPPTGWKGSCCQQEHVHGVPGPSAGRDRAGGDVEFQGGVSVAGGVDAAASQPSPCAPRG